MKYLLILLTLPILLYGQLSIQWNEVIDTQAEHLAAIPGTNHPHFTNQWLTANSWNGSEGYMRWTVAYTEDEDSDGYYFQHPQTGSNAVYCSFIFRVGSTWKDHHVGGEFKWLAFLTTSMTNPRPTIFNFHVQSNTYKTLSPASSAAGGYLDEFGEANPSLNYPNHQYQENSTGHGNDWYFCVCGLVGDRTYVWLWRQSEGQIEGADYTGLGYYARSDAATWNVTWNYVSLLYYIEATTAGDANSYMDIAHMSVHQTLPDPPTGFVTGDSPNDETPPAWDVALTKPVADSMKIALSNISADIGSLYVSKNDSTTVIKTLTTNTAWDTTLLVSGTGWKYVYTKGVDDSSNVSSYLNNIDSLYYPSVITGDPSKPDTIWFIRE